MIGFLLSFELLNSIKKLIIEYDPACPDPFLWLIPAESVRRADRQSLLQLAQIRQVRGKLGAIILRVKKNIGYTGTLDSAMEHDRCRPIHHYYLFHLS
jgi:hypothetical protein